MNTAVIINKIKLFKNNILDIFKIWEGGLAIYGAVIASIIFIIYYSRKKRKNILLTLDTLAPYLILGQAIGRWGNFINKEAHGAITTYENLKNMHLPNFIIEGMYINGSYYIPTFLYESIGCLIIFILIMIIRNIMYLLMQIVRDCLLLRLEIVLELRCIKKMIGCIKQKQ